MEIKLKQYVFLPKSLNMSVGKAASQVAHATFLALSKQRLGVGIERGYSEIKIIDEWKKNGMCVIVLEAKDPEHLNNISKYFEQWKIPSHLYIDEGLNEVLPMTPTALATGIVSEDKFWMFEQFKLFGDKTDAESLINSTQIAKPMIKQNICSFCNGRGQISMYGIGCPRCGALDVGGSIDRILS